MIDEKQPEHVECFNILLIVIKISARCTGEIKSGIAMTSAAFIRKNLTDV
jgi:hypothetical protein